MPPLLLTLDIPEATPSNNVNKGMHYRVYKNLRQHWADLVAEAIPRDFTPASGPLLRSLIYIERHSAGAGLDWDNAYGGLKPLLDCLVSKSERNPSGLGIIVDDSPKHMHEPPYIVQLSAKKGHGRTVTRATGTRSLTSKNSFLRTLIFSGHV